MTFSPDSTRCDSCGARVDALICPYCGVLTHAADSVETQMQAVRELAPVLASATGARLQKLLSAAYVPSHPEVLVEAGVQCLGFIRDGEADDLSPAAIARLESIVVRLRLAPASVATTRALGEFDARIRRYRRSDRALNTVVLVVMIALLALVAWGVIAWMHR